MRRTITALVTAPPQLMKGMRVVELASVLAGPSTGQYLGELGADVIKIESTTGGGDVTRTWKLPSEDPTSSISAYYTSVNMGKKCISVNAKHKKGRELINKLIGQADVVITSYKPGDAKKLFMDYESLKAVNQKIVYASVTGYGEDTFRAGYDAVVQAESGFQYLNGYPDGQPTKIPVALMDVLSSHQLKQAILLALWNRERTGLGSHVSVSLIESAVSALTNQAASYLHCGVEPKRIGSDHPSICPYGTVFDTKTGSQVVLAIGSDKQYSELCRTLQIPVLDDHKTNPQRVRNRESCKAHLIPAIKKYERSDLLSKLQAASVPAGAINTVGDVFTTIPEISNLVVRSSEGEYLGLRQSAASFPSCESSDTSQTLTAAPTYSQNTRSTLTDVLGLNESEIDSLISDKVIAA